MRIRSQISPWVHRNADVRQFNDTYNNCTIATNKCGADPMKAVHNSATVTRITATSNVGLP
jgi:hypothetical protein